MRRLVATAALLALAACSGGSEQPIELEEGDLWISGVTVVSMEREEPLRDAHVVVRGDRIVWVGAPPGSRAGIEPIDGTGRFLVPGLIDGHVHLGAPPPGMTAVDRARHRRLVSAYETQLPRSFLYFGFTTVVELGAKDRSALARVRATELAPTVIDCGDPLVIANGYPMAMRRRVTARLAEFPNFLYDPSQAEAIPSSFSPSEHSPEAAVARVRASGGRCVKAFYEPGNPADPFPLPTEAMMRAVRSAAEENALPLLMHANSLDAHRFAAAAAPHAVAHGLWSWPGLMSADVASGPFPASLIAQVHAVLDAERSANVAYMPTLRVIDGLVDLDGPEFLERPQLARVLPRALVDWYGSLAGQATAHEDNPGGPVSQILRSASRLGVLSLAYTESKGSRILFGSDTPSGGGYGNPPGFNGFLEMRAMEAAGFRPARVLAAATIENAKFFGIDQDVGTIAVGRVADLLLLDRDPLASTEAFDSIRLVILKGRVVPRDSLAVRP